MANNDPLMIRATREAAETFNDLLQVILMEAEFLARHDHVKGDAVLRLARLVEAARKAASLSRATWGLADPHSIRAKASLGYPGRR